MIRRWGKSTDISATVGADGFTDWQEPVTRGYRIRCCDCGLVHIMDFRISRQKIQFRVARDNRSTASIRSAWLRSGVGAEIGARLLKAITKWAKIARRQGAFR